MPAGPCLSPRRRLWCLVCERVRSPSAGVALLRARRHRGRDHQHLLGQHLHLRLFFPSPLPAAPPPRMTPADPSGSQDLAPFWAAAADHAAPAVRAERRALRRGQAAAPPLRIARVGQLDAELLDDELQTMLLAPLRSALDTIRTGLAHRFQPELMLLLRLALFRLAICRSQAATYGAAMHNLRYRNEWAHGSSLPAGARDAPLSTVQKVAYPIVTAILPYAHARLSSAAAAAASAAASRNGGHSSSSSGDHSSFPYELSSSASSSAPSYARLLPRLRTLSLNQVAHTTERLTEMAQRLLVALSFLNLSAFLINGKYRSLADRVLGIRLVYANRSAVRNVSFEFLNRQLVWQALTEFLVFLLPLLRAKRVARRVRRIVAQHTTNVKRLLGTRSARDGGKADAEEEAPIAAHLPDHLCPLCWVRMGGPQSEAHVEARGDTPQLQLSQGLSANPLDPSTFASAAAAVAAPEDSYSETTSPSTESGTRSGAAGIEAEALVSLPARASPCGCAYDYYCLASALLSGENAEQTGGTPARWACLRCGQGVSRVTRA